MNTEIYIISHKEFEKPKLEGYKSLLVGSIFHPDIKEKFDYCDDAGDNISLKNKSFCELTGLYWIWKNSNADIIGLCHYRRYFTKSKYSNNPKYFLSVADVDTLMSYYSIIVPIARYYKETTYQALNIAPNLADAMEMRRAINNLYPDYLDQFDAYYNGNKCYLYNMFIMNKKLLNEYCKWLFDILFFIEQEYPADMSDPYRSRLFGFLSERLIYVWIKKNIPNDKIKEVRVIKTDENAHWLVGQDIKNQIRNMYFKLHR